MQKQFDFGSNWRDFSIEALTPERVVQAREDFQHLIGKLDGSLQGKSFLDIGFGQGLSLLSAAAMGASTVGCDINPTCAAVLDANRIYFPEFQGGIPVVVGSILDPGVIDQLLQKSPGGGGYDIVHSWGVLHHTGDMATAIRNAVRLVRPNGSLVIAIYNRHWSSKAWLAIKWTYMHLPMPFRKLMIAVLYPVIFAAKWMVTRQDPRRQSRGMDFYYNVVDWVGGYPYEYASIKEICDSIEPLGFSLIAAVAAEVPTGCNEFVFSQTTISGSA